mgnify:CR=1 FL=1
MSEFDAIFYFDDVKVTWDRVLVHRDTDLCPAQFHISVKRRFLPGKLARDAIGSEFASRHEQYEMF